MSDVIAGRIASNVTNAVCNAGGKLLKMVELEYKYAGSPKEKHRSLAIAFESPALVSSGAAATPETPDA